MTEAEHSLKEVISRFAAVGFKKRAGWTFTMESREGFLGVLGLNRATRHHGRGEVSIYPIVGVRHHETERLVAELRGDHPHPYNPSTISRPLADLLQPRRFVSWLVTTPPDPAVLDDMVETIGAYGVPFFRSNSELGAMLRSMEHDFGHGLEYRFPVACLLAGDPQRARQLIQRSLTELGDAQSLYATQFRGFAHALLRRLDTGGEASDVTPSSDRPERREGMSLIQVSPEALAWELRSYGEDDVADQIPKLSEKQMARISELAGLYAVQFEISSGKPMLLAKAVSLAAVDVVEGKPRTLKRKVRRLRDLQR